MPIIRLNPDSPPGRKLQQLQTLYYSLVAVPLVLFLVFYLQADQPNYQPVINGEGLLWVHVLVWLVVLALAGLTVKSYNKRIGAHNKMAPLEGKFDHYVRESRRIYFILAPLMLLPIGAVWATGLIFYGALFSLMLILVASLRPTVEQFMQRYRLSKEEQEELKQYA